MSRPPKKYVDRQRTKFTSEWIAWHEEQIELGRLASDDGLEMVFMHSWGYSPDVYFPEKYGKEIPPEGAWILIIDVPPAYLSRGFDVPPLSMWRARPYQLNDGAYKTRNGAAVYPKQAVISTPGGDLHLWPREYAVTNDPMKLLSDPDTEIHSLGGEAVLDEDQMFYLMSRGISQEDATMLLIEQVESTDFIYVTMPQFAVNELYGAGQSLQQHMMQNPRKVAV